MPRFKHDCDKCQYHGVLALKGYPTFDVYTCEEFINVGDRVSLILRHGDEGSHYLSLPVRLEIDRGLFEPYASARKFILTSDGKVP